MSDAATEVGSPQTERSDQEIEITLNGEPVAVNRDEMLIDACEKAGVYIPRFCYHRRLSAVGMCRMCLVEVDTGRGPALTPSCMVKVSEAMVVETESEATRSAQDGVLELLLINHPLDCPVCDKGGECPLQDQTVSYGPGESRFIEEKRHFEKPIEVSDIVQLDRERCILCDRCTRFASEVAGDPLIHFMHRGNNTEVNTFPDEPFSSYFSGNTVQLCPVGALTATPYRFKARPWDLSESTSTMPNAMGDRVLIQSSQNRVLRYLGVDSDPVNWGWLTDRDRFSFEATMSELRVTQPLVRGDRLGSPNADGGELVASSWTRALDQVVSSIEEALDEFGPEGIAVIGGARLTNESQYAWAKFAKGILGTDHVDAQLGDGLPAELVGGLARTTIAEVCEPGSTVVFMSGDPKEELGTLYLRLRHAAINDGVRIIELTPNQTGLSEYAAHSLRVRPGDLPAIANALVDRQTELSIGSVSATELEEASETLRQARAPKVIVGRSSMADHSQLTVDGVNALARIEGTAFLPALRRGNINGAIDMGLAPGLLPGRTSLEAAREWFTQQWGKTPRTVGGTTSSILTAASTGKVGLLVLLGADPLADFCDPELALAGLSGARSLLSIDLFINSSGLLADVLLPATAFGEAAGTHTNLEGRVTKLRQEVTPPGTSRPDWMIATELAQKLGQDLGFVNVDQITDEIAEVSGIHAGIDSATVAAAPEGVLVSDRPADEFPPALQWAVKGEPTTPPQLDRYSYRLVLDRTMYDQGSGTSASPSLARLVDPGSVRMHPSDASRLGVADGSMVRISSPRASFEAPVKVDGRVARGVLAVAHNHPGVDARCLIERDEMVTDVRIETL